MTAYENLLNGYRKFKDKYLATDNEQWRESAKSGQTPKVMVITCSDSRVDPNTITSAGLGEIFSVHNVANLVPPYHESGDTHHSTSAAVEYAVTALKVEHIIVMGHSGCGGIRALVDKSLSSNEDNCCDNKPYSFIGPWMEIASKAAEFTDQEKSDMTADQLASLCERNATLVSLDNLQSFPWVDDAMKAGNLSLHAWHFDIGSGAIECYSGNSGEFEKLC